MSEDKLIALIIKHEGLELKPYKDTVGKLTIGVGRNLDDVGISEQEARLLLKNDIDRSVIELEEIFPAFHQYPEEKQNALISMIFNLGKTRFLKFKKMIKAIELGHWRLAGLEALDSKWATQVGKRAQEIADALSEES